jgi:uncharacterized membrane protein YfcA
MFDLSMVIDGINLWWPGLILLGLMIGFLTGMFGVGGGFLLTPFLNIFFGIPYPIAVGSGLAQIFVTGATSAWKHWRNRNVDPLLGLIMAGGALGGTEIGVRLLKLLSLGGSCVINGRSLVLEDVLMSSLFLVLMVLVAVHIFRESAGNDAEEVDSTIAGRFQKYRIRPVMEFPRSGITSLSLWIPLFLSFLVGILTGFMGVGGGFIAFPLLVYVLGVPTVIAVGTSAFQILFSTGYGALRHAGQGHVELLLVGLLLVGSFVGVQFGVYATKFCGGHKIRRYFAYVIGLGILVILGDSFQKIWG